MGDEGVDGPERVSAKTLVSWAAASSLSCESEELCWHFFPHPTTHLLLSRSLPARTCRIKPTSNQQHPLIGSSSTMFAPQQQPHGPTFNAHQATLQQQQQALAPPSLREILDAFSKDGNGDRDMLMSLLASKRAEEEVRFPFAFCRPCLPSLSSLYRRLSFWSFVYFDLAPSLPFPSCETLADLFPALFSSRRGLLASSTTRRSYSCSPSRTRPSKPPPSSPSSSASPVEDPLPLLQGTANPSPLLRRPTSPSSGRKLRRRPIATRPTPDRREVLITSTRETPVRTRSGRTSWPRSTQPQRLDEREETRTRPLAARLGGPCRLLLRLSLPSTPSSLLTPCRKAHLLQRPSLRCRFETRPCRRLRCRRHRRHRLAASDRPSAIFSTQRERPSLGRQSSRRASYGEENRPTTALLLASRSFRSSLSSPCVSSLHGLSHFMTPSSLCFAYLCSHAHSSFPNRCTSLLLLGSFSSLLCPSLLLSQLDLTLQTSTPLFVIFLPLAGMYLDDPSCSLTAFASASRACVVRAVCGQQD